MADLVNNMNKFYNLFSKIRYNFFTIQEVQYTCFHVFGFRCQQYRSRIVDPDPEMLHKQTRHLLALIIFCISLSCGNINSLLQKFQYLSSHICGFLTLEVFFLLNQTDLSSLYKKKGRLVTRKDTIKCSLPQTTFILHHALPDR